MPQGDQQSAAARDAFALQPGLSSRQNADLYESKMCRSATVWSRSEETGEDSYRPVARTFVTPDQATLELKVVGDGGPIETIEVTGEHPFWVIERGWVAVQELRPCDEVRTSRGGQLRVSGIRLTDGTKTVYNFEVEDFHTYFVGEVGAWALRRARSHGAQHPRD
jgi:hypothetical protein